MLHPGTQKFLLTWPAQCISKPISLPRQILYKQNHLKESDLMDKSQIFIVHSITNAQHNSTWTQPKFAIVVKTPKLILNQFVGLFDVKLNSTVNERIIQHMNNFDDSTNKPPATLTNQFVSEIDFSFINYLTFKDCNFKEFLFQMQNSISPP